MDVEKEIERLIEIALKEDLGQGDITSEACIKEQARTQGVLLTKQSGTVAGLPYVKRIFELVDPSIEFESKVPEGSQQKAGTIIASIRGPVRGILGGERTALNLLQHTSGVATATAAYVRKVSGYDCEILDTRATLPGLRALEKYAVRVAGGTVHRYGLDDRFIIKKNYLAFLAGKHKHPIIEAVRRVKAYRPHIPIEVEVRRYEDLDEALQTEVSAVMLENMKPEEVRRCVKKVHQHKKRAYAQSGAGITLETIREYAETGVDGISIGALTHSVRDLHISLRLVV